jgi:hypothetical protein
VTVTPTPEPTEPVISETSEPDPAVPSDNDIWKLLTYLFGALFIVTGASTAWLLVDKAKNRDRIIKIKRV